jgi:hypothetical protein
MEIGHGLQKSGSSHLSWAEERNRAVEEIKKLDPSDRLGFYASLIKLNTALFESVRGWDSWLRNPAFIDTFAESELKEIYSQFKEVTLRFLEEDVKWTGKKEKSFPAILKAPKNEKPEVERRYA